MTKRKKIPKDVESTILVASRRRCCFCFGLDGDSSQKEGQIAHLDRNPTNVYAKNLAFMCFFHHNWYDTIQSQGKNPNITEARRHRDELYRYLSKGLKAAQSEPVWNLPLCNPYFTGRDSEILVLRKRLSTKGLAGVTQIQAIHGLGGIGKSQTAIAYAQKYKAQYAYAFWIDSQNEESIQAGLRQVSELLGLSTSRTQVQESAEVTIRWLGKNKRWLLIFDNADHPELLKLYLPNVQHGHIIVTSRNRHLDCLGIMNPIELRGMLPKDAISFLIKRTCRQLVQGEEQVSARSLAKELGYLPLALEQAAAYIYAKQATFHDYLKSYKQLRLRLLEQQHPVADDYPWTVATTWEINFLEVEKEPVVGQASADLLRLSAFLASENIPIELLVAGQSSLGDVAKQAIGALVHDPLAVDKVLEPLSRFALITRDIIRATYSIHRLVQEVVRSRLDPSDRNIWTERTIECLLLNLTSESHDNWIARERLLPHALSGIRLVDTLHQKTPSAICLFNLTGVLLTKLAYGSEAVRVQRRSVEICKTELQEETQLLLGATEVLGNAYYCQGKNIEAERTYRTLLSLNESVHGLAHPLTAASMVNLAESLRQQKKYEEAETLLRQALAIQEILFGKTSPYLAITLVDIGGLCGSLEKYEESECFLKRALGLTVGPPKRQADHLAVVKVSLAKNYAEQGKEAEAEALYKEAIDLRKQAVGPCHPGVAWFMEIYALFLRSLTRSDEASQIETKARRIRANHARERMTRMAEQPLPADAEDCEAEAQY